MKKAVFLLAAVCLLFTNCSKDRDETWGFENFNYSGDWNGDYTGEQYNEIIENPFIEVAENPVSTFSIDVDGASYSNTRRFLNNGSLPPADAIRTEEVVNYFSYDYSEPSGNEPVFVDGEVTVCPWDGSHKLIRIGMKGKHINKQDLPAANIVFLIDVSGSMSSSDKLELLKQGYILFVNELRDQDKVAIVTYAGSWEIALPSTYCSDKQTIINAINELGSGGSTAGSEGIITAYKIAEQNFIENGNNRVILGTDGDFNVGISDQDELVALIEEKRESGVYLTVLGVGTGNLNDGMMEQLADNGNGNYEYIDNIEQAKKVFIYDYNSFYTVAQDVKIQIEFNAELVHSYRLIGYENRVLNEEDFEDDDKDAGEIGSDQTITALYEIIPTESTTNVRIIDIDFRYKYPGEEHSNLFSLEVFDSGSTFENASENMRFAASAASFALLLRDSDYKGNATYDYILEWAGNAMDHNPHNYKTEFLILVQKAKTL